MVLGPEIRYARSREGLRLSYAMLGTGPPNLIRLIGAMTDLRLTIGDPIIGGFERRLSTFSGLVTMDERGAGMSDPVALADLPTLEQRVDDALAVLDDTGVEERHCPRNRQRERSRRDARRHPSTTNRFDGARLAVGESRRRPRLPDWVRARGSPAVRRGGGHRVGHRVLPRPHGTRRRQDSPAREVRRVRAQLGQSGPRPWSSGDSITTCANSSPSSPYRPWSCTAPATWSFRWPWAATSPNTFPGAPRRASRSGQSAVPRRRRRPDQ